MPLKPRLRGVLHQWACAGSLPLGLVLVSGAGTARARIALSVYALSLIRCSGSARCITGSNGAGDRLRLDAPA
jgi:hypothetical protein